MVPPTPAVLRFHSAASCSTLRQRGERQAAAGREGLSGRQEQYRLGASADVTPVLKTVFHRQSQQIVAVQCGICFDELKFEISGSFNFNQHEISLDLSSHVPVFKVPLKFKSRDFGACLCHHQRSKHTSCLKHVKTLGFRVHPCL